MSERVKKTTVAGKSKVTKAKSVSVKPGIKSTPVKRSGCFKDRGVKSSKKSSKKAPRPKPGYSLYSSDSEEQISSLNCGIDKCSELLANLIQRKKGSQWAKPEIRLSHEGIENQDVVTLVGGAQITPQTQQRDRVFIPTAGTESPDTQVANMVDGRLARSRAPLVEVRTPFNQRLISSTPDPEKTKEDEERYTQLIPEKDTNTADKPIDRFSFQQTNISVLQQKVVLEKSDVKIDKNQNYIKDEDGFEKGFRPVSFRDEDLIEGVKRFEDSFPACHNRKSSIGDFQYYLHRESTGFSPPQFPSTQDRPPAETVNQEASAYKKPLMEEKTNDSVVTNTNEDNRARNRLSSGFDRKQSFKEVEQKEPEPHNRDYLEQDFDQNDSQDGYSAPMFNSMQVKMFGPGYRKRNNRDEDSDDEDDQCTVENESSQFTHPLASSREANRYNLSQKIESKEIPRDYRMSQQYSKPVKHDTAETQYDLSQKIETKHSFRTERNLQHEELRFKQVSDIQDMHLSTPMPSPARPLHQEPRAILGRHVNKQPEQIEQQSERIFINPNIDPLPESPDEQRDFGYVNEERSNKRVQFQGVEETKETENYPSPLINPSNSLDTNVCISKPVTSQLPMLETPANSPVCTGRNAPKDLREATLRRISREAAQGHEPHLFGDNIRPNRGASDNLERRFQEEANRATEYPENAEGFETAPFQPELGEHHWTMTPVNSPAPRVTKDSKVIERMPATPAVNLAQKSTPTPQGCSLTAGQGPQTLPARLDAVTGPRKLRYLVQELGEVCKRSGCESDLQYVVEDLQECLDSIPQLKPTFNLQTEMDLLLQPLRSENSQLRRRLRIVNQQLKERERQEKENTNHGINFEMLHLQTDNASLHRQLKEEKELSQRLNHDMERLKYERQRMIVVLSEKEKEASRVREDCLKENQKLQFELELARKQTEGNHLRHAASESENRILQVSLKQRDVEINRLQDLVQTLKDGVGEVLRSLDSASHGAHTDNSFSLQRMLLLLNNHGAGFSPAKSVMSDPGHPSSNKETVSSAKKNLHFETRLASSSKKSKVSPLSKEAVHQHNMVHKETPTAQDIASLEKEFRNYMSPFNSSPKSDMGSVTQMLLRNCSGRSRENKNPVKMHEGQQIRQVTKIPQPNFDASDSGLDTEGTPGATSRYPPVQALQLETSSLQSEAFKGTELDLSLSTIEEDVRSVVSAVTSTTSLSTVDDKAFRDGIAALDANIAKVLNALEKTKKMFS